MFDKFRKTLLLLWIIPIALVYLHATDTFDQDLGRHLMLGNIIWHTKQVPKINLFSYTNPKEPVFNSHWGSEVIFYLTYQKFGISGLILLSTIVNTLAFWMIFLVASTGGLLIPSILFIPFLYILLDRSWVRPEMFGNLFFAFLVLLLFNPKIRKKGKWFLPVISLLWVNLHITGIFGAFCIAVVLLQDTIDATYQKRVIKENVFILFLTTVSLCINPYGPSLILSSLTILSKYGYTIVENQSWFFLKDFGFPLVAHIFFAAAVIFCSFFTFLVRPRKVSMGEWILLIVVTILTFRFVRNEVMLASIGFVSASYNFALLNRKSWVLLLSPLFLVASVSMIIGFHNSSGLPLGFGNKESYKKGVDFFLSNKYKGPIFNNFDIGGYLIYRLYPRFSVFVDNRPEAYPVSFFATVYKPMQFDKRTFERYVDKYGIETIIWGRHDITDWSITFLSWLPQEKRFKTVYMDDSIVVLTKTP